ncbi:MAG: hypothetical protein OXG74_11930 [Acidobacteria bacterium]|nr:hypothetical protein [Acidobacteriota bacterium]
MNQTDTNAVIETALRQDVEKLDKKIDQLQKRLDRLVANRDAIMATLEYRRPTRKRARKSVDLHVTAVEIKGMSVEEAAVLIAQRNDGRIKSTPARELMKEAAILPRDGRASTRLYHFLSTSARFESVGRGEYQLDENYEPEPDVDPAELEMLERLRHGDPLTH